MKPVIRRLKVYSAYVGLVPRLFLAYRGWVWMGLFVNALSMLIFYYFWKAVYEQQETLSGMDFQQTMNYVMLAQFFAGGAFPSTMFYLGRAIREGTISIELLRPIDLEWALYVQSFVDVLLSLITRLPLLLLAVVAFGLELPGDPLIWLSFLISMVLGFTAFYLFDWTFACLAFYTTEVWGISVMRYGIDLFFSGALIPLVMMPGWLETLARALPMSQLVYVPLSFLSGITEPSDAPVIWLTQIAWIITMGVLSRVVYSVSLRRVTVQGG